MKKLLVILATIAISLVALGAATPVTPEQPKPLTEEEIKAVCVDLTNKATIQLQSGFGQLQALGVVPKFKINVIVSACSNGELYLVHNFAIELVEQKLPLAFFSVPLDKPTNLCMDFNVAAKWALPKVANEEPEGIEMISKLNSFSICRK